MLELKIYVAGKSEHSQAGINALAALAERGCLGAYTLEVVDVLQNPEAAREAGVFAVPTLERTDSERTVRLLGDFTDSRIVEHLLGLAADGVGSLKGAHDTPTPGDGNSDDTGGCRQ